MLCENELRTFDLFLLGAESDLSGDALVAETFKKLTDILLLPLALHFERLTSERKPKRVKIYSSFAKFDSCHYTCNASFCIFTPIFQILESIRATHF
jgi:hypothetical protein